MSQSRMKQVCTIGPASAERIAELVSGGMDVARVNFAHGTAEDHRTYVHAVRAAAHSARRSVAVMVDLPGPKLRLGELVGGELLLVTGAVFVLRGEGRAVASAAVDKAEGADEVPAEIPAADTAEIPAEVPTEILAAVPAETMAAGSLEDTGGGAAAETAPDDAGVDAAADAPEAAPQSTAELSAEVAAGDASGATVLNGNPGTQLQVGDRVLLADGAAELEVTAIDGSDVLTRVVSGGVVRSRSGVGIPSGRLAQWGLTEDDRAAVRHALELRADLVAQSFVRSADDVLALRALLPADGPRLVAKIETRAAIDNFDAICAAADGIIVARGDLGVDVPFEDVPMIQKDLIRRATVAGRFSIVATQMLESMTGAPRPTRAEASDVANAVLDGADAVMLSAETAIGAFPLEALRAMERICLATETGAGHHAPLVDDPGGASAADEVIAAATYMAARENLGAIWCFTRSGRTAELLSLSRPRVPIAAFTLSPVVARRLAVRGGIIPLVLSAGAKSVPLIEQMELAWRSQRPAGDFDTVLLVTTSTQPAGINRLEIHHLSGAAAARP